MNGDKLMQLNATAMSGPEFLDALADASAASGLDVNADIFRIRAGEWSRHLQMLADLGAQLQDLRDRLDHARRALATP